MILSRGTRQDPASLLKDPARVLKDPARVLKGVRMVFIPSSTFVLL